MSTTVTSSTSTPSSTSSTTSSSSSTSSTNGSSTAATSSQAAIAASNKAAAQALLTSLGAGSGVDVSSLAQNLVNAEKVPQANLINGKITQEQSRVSGYSAVSYVLTQVNTALNSLKNQRDFNTLSVSSSSSAFSATATTDASPGDHDVDVLSLAKAQRSISASFSSASTSLNNGNAMSFALTVGSGSSATTSYVNVAAGSDTPSGLVDAINASSAGVTATLANTGDASNPYKVVLIGQTGAASSFSLTPVSSLGNFAVAHDGHVNNSSNVSFQITPAGAGSPITLSSADTPDAMVAAINGAVDSSGNSLGLTAKLVSGVSTNASGVSTNTTRIVVSGPTAGYNLSYSTDGTSYNSAISEDGSNSAIASSLGLATNQSATDASLKVDGVAYTRSTNSFSDVLKGVTFNLKGLTTTGVNDSNGNPVSNTGSISITRDTSAISTNLNALVSAYNDAMTIFGEVTNPKSTLDTYGATLVGDSTVRMIKSQLRTMLTQASSTPGSTITSLWQIGISVDATGTMSLDSNKLNSAISSNYDDIVKVFTGNQNDLSSYSTASGGVAGDAYKKITTMLSSTGVIQSQSTNAETQITKYEDQLTTLNTRMDSLLTRYQTQFAAMNSMVGNANTEKASLKSTFAGMMSVYTGSSSG